MPRLSPKSPVRVLTKDNRDFRLGAVFDLPKPSEIPNTDWSFDTPLEIKSQIGDTCTGHAAASSLEDHEGIPLNPYYIFAKAKQIEGDHTTYGSEIRTVCKAVTKYGALPQNKSPFADKSRDFLANWKNWPEVYDGYAIVHKQASYFAVHTGPYDTFDNIRTALWRFRDKKHSVVAGSYWYVEWGNPAGGVIPKVYNRNFGEPQAHAFKVRITQKMINGEPYLAIQQSYGPGIGDHGTQYFPREVVNREWKDFGAFMFVDIDPELARAMQISWIEWFLTTLFDAVRKLRPTPPTPAPAPEPEPVTPTPVPPPDESLQAMARRVCIEEGIGLNTMADILATIHAESGWNPRALGRNRKNGKILSSDWGLCQFNDAKNPKTGVPYWIGPGAAFVSTEEVLSNPEKNVHVMCQAWKRGRRNDWKAYALGHYKKYLTLYS